MIEEWGIEKSKWRKRKSTMPIIITNERKGLENTHPPTPPLASLVLPVTYRSGMLAYNSRAAKTAKTLPAKPAFLTEDAAFVAAGGAATPVLVLDAASALAAEVGPPAAVV